MGVEQETGLATRGLASRFGGAGAAWTAAALVVAVTVLSGYSVGTPFYRVVPLAGRAAQGSDGTLPRDAGTSTTTVTQGAGSQGAQQQATQGTAAGGPGKASGSTRTGLACAPGKNGGSTDTGVTANQIKLASTVVKSGIAVSFLGDVEYGMEAVMNKVNRQGGICGRQLTLQLVDDGWNPTTGQQYLRAFINEGYFALAVVPSSEGLRLAINGGDIDRAGIPVVGSDGMLIDQYTDPWVWPIATSTNGFMHIIAKWAHDQGAQRFGLVYENDYHFGPEGEKAFVGAIGRTGGTIPSGCDVAIASGQTSYSSTVQNFNTACGPTSGNPVDFVALLMEPTTAAVWVGNGGYLGNAGKAIGAAGPQTLFSHTFGEDFARECPSPCNVKFMVWTGFYPPEPPNDTLPAVQQYINGMQVTQSQADYENSFVEGGYDGMELLVQAMQAAGPDLTRARLRQVLDTMRFDSGLSNVEQFGSGSHFADIYAQAFQLTLSGRDFSGFRSMQTGWIQDPWVGQDALK